MTLDELIGLANFVEGKGREIAEDAGYAGERHDRGGGALQLEAKAFRAGLKKPFPNHGINTLPNTRNKTTRNTPNICD